MTERQSRSPSRPASIGSFSSLSTHSTSSEDSLLWTNRSSNTRHPELPSFDGVIHLTAYLAHQLLSENVNRRNVLRFCEIVTDGIFERYYDVKGLSLASRLAQNEFSGVEDNENPVEGVNGSKHAEFAAKHDFAWVERLSGTKTTLPSLLMQTEEITPVEFFMGDEITVTLVANASGASDPIFYRAAIAAYISFEKLNRMFEGGRVFYIAENCTIVKHIDNNEFMHVLPYAPSAHDESDHGPRYWPRCVDIPYFFRDMPDYAPKLSLRWWMTGFEDDRYGGKRPMFRQELARSQTVPVLEFIATRFGSLKEKSDHFKADQSDHLYGFGYYPFTMMSEEAFAEVFLCNNMARHFADFYQGKSAWLGEKTTTVDSAPEAGDAGAGPLSPILDVAALSDCLDQLTTKDDD